MMEFFYRVMDRFVEIAHLQRHKGLQTYGKGLDPTDKLDFFRMCEEEICDAWMYLQAAKEQKEASKKSITLIRINEIIGIEMEYAKKVNPQMALGMAQVRTILNRELDDGGK